MEERLSGEKMEDAADSLEDHSFYNVSPPSGELCLRPFQSLLTNFYDEGLGVSWRMNLSVRETSEIQPIHYSCEGKTQLLKVELKRIPKYDEQRAIPSFGLHKKAIHSPLLLVLLMAICLPGESKLVEVPKNGIVGKGPLHEINYMECESDYQTTLTWHVHKNNHSERETLYSGYDLRTDAESFCTVINDAHGKVYLKLVNKTEAGQTYICMEPGTLAVASADIIWIGDLICHDSSTEDLVNLKCSIEFQGNWAPTMEWKQHRGHHREAISVNSTTVSNQMVTSTLVMPVHGYGRHHYDCTIKFSITGKPHNTTATNVPEYDLSWKSSMFPKSKAISGLITGTAINILVGITAAIALLMLVPSASFQRDE